MTMLDRATEAAAHRVRVLARADAGGGLTRLTMAPEQPARESYLRAGQYVRLSTTTDARSASGAFFALAGDTSSETWELLVRPASASARAILAVPDDGELVTSPALGSGFPAEEARGRPLLLAATGSGVAAMRALVMLRVRESDAARTTLLLGVRTAADVPLEPELSAWRGHGVRVTVCLSREDVPHGRPEVARGYVQEVARRAGAGSRGGMIFAAGLNAMVMGMRQLARELGVAPADVRTNHAEREPAGEPGESE